MRKIKRLPKVTDEMRQRSDELRKDMTDVEWKLWARLKSRQLDTKFLRQRPVGPYICDFISIDAGLIVELDGSQHFNDKNIEYDEERDEYLKSLGFEVLRFTNREVLQNMEGVLEVISEKI